VTKDSVIQPGFRSTKSDDGVVNATETSCPCNNNGVNKSEETDCISNKLKK
jgi:hypothetical protein